MKKLLILFTVSTVAIASDSYREIAENLPLEIREKCSGHIEKNPIAFKANEPMCKQIVNMLHAMKENKLPYKRWDNELHIPIAKLLRNDRYISNTRKDYVHAYTEGLSQYYAKKWIFSKWNQNGPVINYWVNKFVDETHPGVALHFEFLKEETKKTTEFTFAPPKDAKF